MSIRRSTATIELGPVHAIYVHKCVAPPKGPCARREDEGGLGARRGFATTRIILFCDVERPLRTRVMQAVNRFVSRTFIRAGATQNTEAEPIGAANRVYALLGKGSNVLTRLKRRNRTAFRAVKYALIAALAYWIFVY